MELSMGWWRRTLCMCDPFEINSKRNRFGSPTCSPNIKIYSQFNLAPSRHPPAIQQHQNWPIWNNRIHDTANKMETKSQTKSLVWSAFSSVLVDVKFVFIRHHIVQHDVASRRWTTSGWRFWRRIESGSWHEREDCEVFAWKEEKGWFSVIQPLSLIAVTSITFFIKPAGMMMETTLEPKQKLTLEIFVEFLLAFAKGSEPFFSRSSIHLGLNKYPAIRPLREMRSKPRRWRESRIRV